VRAGVLLRPWPRPVVREAEAIGGRAIRREPAAARDFRADEHERLLEERGGWDEV
jgi:hypothetical protein